MNPGDCDDDGAAGILMPIPSFHRRGQYQYFPKFQNTSSFFVPPWFDEWSEALLAFPFMRLLVITIVTVLEDNGVVIKKKSSGILVLQNTLLFKCLHQKASPTLN